MISAEIVADSISLAGKRLTTFKLTYPRFVHAEFMTHRLFSRNAASSRAIPSKRIRAAVRNDMAVPIYWGANQKGMAAEVELVGWRKKAVQVLWVLAAYPMLFISWLLEKLGLHKQIANRILEPWFNITVIVTGTHFGNFYHLRNHPKAQPEIQELARCMLAAQNASVPVLLKPGEWHLPFVTDEERHTNTQQTNLMLSTARCARISYNNQDGLPASTIENVELFNRLVKNTPKHSSPAEHQGTPSGDPNAWSGNFQGWVQHRKLIPDENLPNYPGLTV